MPTELHREIGPTDFQILPRASLAWPLMFCCTSLPTHCIEGGMLLYSIFVCLAFHTHLASNETKGWYLNLIKELPELQILGQSLPPKFLKYDEYVGPELHKPWAILTKSLERLRHIGFLWMSLGGP